MNYCSNCGSKNLEFKIPENDHRPRFVCSDCSYIFYDNPQVVVGTIPLFNEKVLLAKRGINPQKDKWNLPAGFLENNESIEEGALRETIEETASDVGKMELNSIYYSKSHHLYIFYKAHLTSDKFETNFESPEIAFFDESEIPWNDLAFESNEFALKEYFKASNSGIKINFKTEKF